MSAVMEHMHQRAEQKNEPRKIWHNMGTMLSQQKITSRQQEEYRRYS
jgi:hypothetical protein